MFALNTDYYYVGSLTSSGNIQKKIANKHISNTVISKNIRSLFSIPDSPKYINIEKINKKKNIYILKKLEYEYDNFLKKKYQILLLLNIIDEVFEIRDVLIMRINAIKRQERNRQIRETYTIL